MKEYKRLTMINNGFIDTNCRNCKQCKKVGRKYICNDMTACNEEIITRLAELEDKIEQGTLFELGKPFIRQYESIPKQNKYFICKAQLVYLSNSMPKAEAEKKLKELQGE